VKIVVFGGGAVGSVLAAALHERVPGDVTLVGRHEHVEAIRGGGLHLKGVVSGTYRVEAEEKVTHPLEETLVVMTVKATALESALREISPLLRASTRLLLLQNGYGIRDLAARTIEGTPLPPEHLFQGVTAFGSTFLEPGTVVDHGGTLILPEDFLRTEFAAPFTGTFIALHPARDMTPHLWKKLLLNCAVNPLSVLLRGPNRVIAESRFDELKEMILAEARAVAAAEGVVVNVDAAYVNRHVSSDNLTSMLQDVMKGKRTEIDFMNGAITALGRARGVPVPVNAFVTALIKAIESRRLDTDWGGRGI